MHLVTPSGKRLKYPFEGMVLDRVAHDEALVQRAESEGAKYLVGTRVKRVGSQSVTLSDGRIFEAKVIVGAGGHHDIVRRTGWSEKSLNIPVKFAIKKESTLKPWSCISEQSLRGAMHGSSRRTAPLT